MPRKIAIAKPMRHAGIGLRSNGDKQARPFLPAPGATVIAGFWFYAD
jgi:hypothetical protein